MSASSIFIRVFNEAGSQVIDKVTRLTYVHSDSAEDYSSIVIETDDIDLPDHPDLQAHKKIIIVWGYVGGKMRSQKVYIWDIKPSYDSTYLRLELVCYCRLAYLKLNSSKQVHNNKSIQDIGQELAQQYGFNYSEEGFELSGDEPVIPPSQAEAETKSLQASESKQATIDSRTAVSYNGAREAEFNFERQSITVARDNTAAPMKAYVFRKYEEGIPQAGASDLALLEKLTKQEKTTNLTIDGHDDELIIRKRNFSQAPYKTYTYKSEPGNLLAFSPGTHTSTKGKGGVSNVVEGWNEESKEYVAGHVDASHNPDTKTGDKVQLPTEEILRKKIYDDIKNPYGVPVRVNGFFKEDFDNTTGAYKRTLIQKLDATRTNWAHITVGGPRENILDFDSQKNIAASDATGIRVIEGFIPVEPQEVVNTVETKKEEIVSQGVNRQATEQSEMYESSAEVIGDVDLESAKVISILNVSKRYSGNYYIQSVTHEVIPDTGYICYLRLLKNAIGKTGNDHKNLVDISAIGGVKNTKPGIANDGSSELFKVKLSKD